MGLLTILGDGSQWHFVSGPWRDGNEHQLVVAPDALNTAGPAMQGMHFAFDRHTVYADCTIHFEIFLKPASDVGIVLRGVDPSNFILVHFPCCGQACRAQHFWAAISQMDSSGYLRIGALELLHRVPSNTGRWLSATIRLTGANLHLIVGDYGQLDTTIEHAPREGHLGFFIHGHAGLRNVRIEGMPSTAKAHWNERNAQPTNWRHPVPAANGIWQQPYDLKRLADGRLILLFNSTETPDGREEARATPNLVTSDDNGMTWSQPLPLSVAGETSAWSGARLHFTPRGRLILLLPDSAGGTVRESIDAGHTWSESTPTNLPFDRKFFLPPHAFLNLADGGILAFVYGRFGAPVSENIWTWGSLHCQAFACRSDDDGRTWSDPVNVDTPLIDANGQAIPGNLDLTEMSAVQLARGRVMGFIRPIYSPWMWETWSDDGGRTWGPCVRGPFAGYAAPNMIRTHSGHLLIAHRLPELTIHCSHDEGVTWDKGTMIDSALWAMGGMIEIAPDVVLYIYWDTYYGLMRSQTFSVSQSGLNPA